MQVSSSHCHDPRLADTAEVAAALYLVALGFAVVLHTRIEAACSCGLDDRRATAEHLVPQSSPTVSKRTICSRGGRKLNCWLESSRDSGCRCTN